MSEGLGPTAQDVPMELMSRLASRFAWMADELALERSKQQKYRWYGCDAEDEKRPKVRLQVDEQGCRLGRLTRFNRVNGETNRSWAKEIEHSCVDHVEGHH